MPFLSTRLMGKFKIKVRDSGGHLPFAIHKNPTTRATPVSNISHHATSIQQVRTNQKTGNAFATLCSGAPSVGWFTFTFSPSYGMIDSINPKKKEMKMNINIKSYSLLQPLSFSPHPESLISYCTSTECSNYK